MKRKFLEDLGLEKEVIDKVMNQNGEDIEAAKGDTEKLNGKITDLEKEIDGYKEQISDRDKQLKDIKKNSGDNEELKKQIETLEKANADTKKNHEAEIRQLKIDSAVESALVTGKAKNVKAVKALLDLNDAKLGEDGSVVGLKEQIAKLAKADDSKFLFDDGKAKFKGATPGDPTDPEPKTVTQKQFNSMTYQDRMKVFEENRELYDSLSKNELEGGPSEEGE